MILGRRWETGFCFLCGFSFSFFLTSRFFFLQAAFLFPAFSVSVRFHVAFVLKKFFSQALLFRRITISFSCHIQLSVPLPFCPPPQTERGPWDSPPSRNCPDIFSISEKVEVLWNAFLSVVSVLSLCTYIITDSKRFVNPFFNLFGNFFSRISVMRGHGARGAEV